MSMIRSLLAAAAVVLALPAWAEVPLGDDGLHKPDWLKDSFKDLREDAAEAAAAGRTLLVTVEQRGCIYCAEMHNEIFTDPRMDRLIREKFDVVQVDLFGGTEMTDTDGELLTEKRMAGKWGVTVTPMLLFFPPELPEGASAPKAAMAVLPGVMPADKAVALFEWAAAGGPDTGRTLAEVIGN